MRRRVWRGTCPLRASVSTLRRTFTAAATTAVQRGSSQPPLCWLLRGGPLWARRRTSTTLPWRASQRRWRNQKRSTVTYHQRSVQLLSWCYQRVALIFLLNGRVNFLWPTATFREGVLPENNSMAPFHISCLSRNKGNVRREPSLENRKYFNWFDGLPIILCLLFPVYLLWSRSCSQIPNSSGGWWDTAPCGAQLQRQKHHGCHLHPFPAQKHWFVLFICVHDCIYLFFSTSTMTCAEIEVVIYCF